MPVTEPFGVCGIEEDTRQLAEMAVAAGGRRALDMGTGTGYVGIYLAQHGFAVDAVDVSRRALQTAQANATAAGLPVKVYRSNLFEAVSGRYDVIAFNPPMNPNESELTRWLTSTLRRWNRLARLLMRLGEGVGVAARHRFLADFVRQAREHLSENGRLLLVLSPREIDALAQALPELVIHSRSPIPSLPPLQIAAMGFGHGGGDPSPAPCMTESMPARERGDAAPTHAPLRRRANPGMTRRRGGVGVGSMVQASEAALQLPLKLPPVGAPMGVGVGFALVLALAVRIILALPPHVLQADEGAYVWLGRNLVTGRGFTFIGIPEVHYTPLFPLVSGLLYLLLGNLEAASKVCFVVLGAGLVVPIYLLARAIYGLRQARVAALLVAVLPALTSHVLYWGSMSEPLYLFLLFWGLWLVWRAWQEDGWRLHAGAALLLSLAYLARPEGLIYVAAAGVWLALVKLCRLRTQNASDMNVRCARDVGGSRTAPTVAGSGAGSAWRHWGAYVAIFALLATPYVLYLHRETGAWMLTGKAMTAYVQDRALAHKDWVTFDEATWGLDSTGEVLYHSKERFSRSFESYILSEPGAFLQGMVDNARTLPSILLAKQGIPRPVAVLLVLALFLQPWSRRRAWAEAFLGGALLVPVVTFWPVLFSVRFLQPVYPIAMIWAGQGAVLLGEWLAESVREIVKGNGGTQRQGEDGGRGEGGNQAPRCGLRPWLRSGLVALPAVVAVLYITSLHPAIVREGRAYMKFNYREAGEWLRAHTPADAVVMSRGAIAAIHAEREWAPFPHAAWPQIVAYGERRRAGYLVISEQEIRQFQPHLEPLLDEAHPPAELELVRTFKDQQGRTIIYRFR